MKGLYCYEVEKLPEFTVCITVAREVAVYLDQTDRLQAGGQYQGLLCGKKGHRNMDQDQYRF